MEPGDGEGEDEAPGSGGIVGRALHAVEELMRNSYYSTSILVALFMLRECSRGCVGQGACLLQHARQAG